MSARPPPTPVSVLVAVVVRAFLLAWSIRATEGLSTPYHDAASSATPSSSTTTTTTTTTPHPPPRRTALSMTLEELGDVLGGTGRARLAHDCYSGGADPHYLFGSRHHPPASTTTTTSTTEYVDEDIVKRKVLPTPRRTQVLGKRALDLLSDLHSHCGGMIEGGLATLVHVRSSADGTTKMLLRLVDGMEVETVLIPFWTDDGTTTIIRGEEGNENDDDYDDNSSARRRSAGRTTVCISSQVGCRQGCTFCATGKMGKLRSLTTDEILAQLFFARKVVRLSQDRTTAHDDDHPAASASAAVALPRISNVVFMGMGEPSDNAPAVRGAIDAMTGNDGPFRLSASRVTVSTVAPTPESFADFVDSRCALAWSVHAADDGLRRRLVPTTRYSMSELRDGLMDALRRRTMRTCMIEVALMDGVNDSLREADELAVFLAHITNNVPGAKVVCNLIPYNDIGSIGMGYTKPPRERIIAFQERMQELGIVTRVRGTRGDDESAACGQLVTSETRAVR